MSGLEVVAAVAGIVGAYAASAGVYYSWRSKRAARKSNAQNQGLEVSLTTGKTGVQKEYDQGFSRLGREFAVGDDITRAELLKYALEIVKLQQDFMVIMAKDSNLNEAMVLPNLPSLLEISDGTRRGVVCALKEQYQRMEQAKPLSNLLTTKVEYRPISGIWSSNGSMSSAQSMFQPDTKLDISSSAQSPTMLALKLDTAQFEFGFNPSGNRILHTQAPPPPHMCQLDVTPSEHPKRSLRELMALKPSTGQQFSTPGPSLKELMTLGPSPGRSHAITSSFPIQLATPKPSSDDQMIRGSSLAQPCAIASSHHNLSRFLSSSIPENCSCSYAHSPNPKSEKGDSASYFAKRFTQIFGGYYTRSLWRFHLAGTQKYYCQVCFLGNGEKLEDDYVHSGLEGLKYHHVFAHKKEDLPEYMRPKYWWVDGICRP